MGSAVCESKVHVKDGVNLDNLNIAICDLNYFAMFRLPQICTTRENFMSSKRFVRTVLEHELSQALYILDVIHSSNLQYVQFLPFNLSSHQTPC